MKKKLKEKQKIGSFFTFGVNLSIKLFSWIVMPMLLAFILGKYLDKKYQTGTMWFLIVLGVAFIISNIGIIKEGLSIMKMLDNSALNKLNELDIEQKKSIKQIDIEK